MIVSLAAARIKAAAGHPLDGAAAQALADRIEELEGLVGLKPVAPFPVALSPLQRLVLGLLIKAPSGGLSKEQMFTAVYGGRPDCEQPASLKVIEVVICQLRRRLRAHGVEIVTTEGGYRLSAGALGRIARLTMGGT